MKSYEYIDPYELDEGHRLGNPEGGMPAWVKDERAVVMWQDVMRPVKDAEGKTVLKTADTASQVFARKINQFLNDRDRNFLVFEKDHLSQRAVYRAAGFSKSKWGRIMEGKMSDIERGNAFAVAIALHLNEKETAELLHAAGFAINYELDLDVAMMYFIRRGIYDMEYICSVLGEFCDVDNGLDCFMFQPACSPEESRRIREEKKARTKRS